MNPKELAEIMEATIPPNWFLKLPKNVRRDLCQVRKAYAAADKKPTQSVLLSRLRAKYEGMPVNTKRFGEFLRNEAGIYPEECANEKE